MTHIVKRKGHKEPFDGKKIYASVYAACLNSHLHKEQAEKIAEAALSEIKAWVADKAEVSSTMIFQNVIEVLKRHHPDVAFMYETHRDIS